jgi:hypothetical protein
MSRDDDGRDRAEPIDVDYAPARGERRGGVGGGAALLLALAAAGAGAAGGAIGPRIPAVQATLDKSFPIAGGGPSEVTSAETLASLGSRLDAIEAIMNTPLPVAASGGAGDAGTAARVFALQAGLRDFETRLNALPSSEQVAALLADVRRLQEELPAVAAEARAAGTAARASYAVVAAAEASNTSGSFEQAHAALVALLPNDPHVTALAPLARTGAPTRLELRDRFERLDNEIIRVATQSRAGAGFWGRVQAALAQWIVVRRRGAGDTPEGIVERAEDHMAANRLDLAVQELNRLPAAPKRVAQPWLDDAARRVEIDTHIVAIRTELSRGS